MERHHGLLFKGGILEIGEGGRGGEVGGVVSFSEDDGFDDDKIMPVDLGVGHYQ